MWRVDEISNMLDILLIHSKKLVKLQLTFLSPTMEYIPAMIKKFRMSCTFIFNIFPVNVNFRIFHKLNVFPKFKSLYLKFLLAVSTYQNQSILLIFNMFV